MTIKILNLGCGTKTSDRSEVINIDWSIYLRLKSSILLRPIVPLVVRGERRRKFDALPDSIMVHDLSKGIPFDSDSVDAVYHSHMLEHLDRDVALKFLNEVKRVLKPGGIHRIVVPDFETDCKAYVTHIASCDENQAESHNHDTYIAKLLEQSVRREARGTNRQSSFRRLVENFFLGDARRRGETHQWMYDRINLSAKLTEAGYQAVHVQDYNSSLIPGWPEYGLDVDDEGNQYKPGSLYMEATK